MTVKNPVLRGFHADPCMLYVHGTYYIATSTFEWYPGVQIHKSTDLVRWEPVKPPLDSERLLAMRGNAASAGVWAPCLTFSDGMFYLVYSNVRSRSSSAFKDCDNFLTTAHSVEGPWSDPVYLNSSGFDASLFHDDDGKKYLVDMEWNHLAVGKARFSGILLQEYDASAQRLVGAVHKIFRGTALGYTEGPHIYKINGWYYLFCAEGGTSYGHAEVVARSRSLFGPYETHPMTYLIAPGSGGINVKAGHASLCEGRGGQWYIAYLSGRPDGNRRCVLGRETSLQPVVWRDDGWMYLENGTNIPSDSFEADADPYAEPGLYECDFQSDQCLCEFQTLRRPITSDSFRVHDGRLTLVGRESPMSEFDQTILFRRQTHFKFRAETLMEFEPESFRHMAGLIYRYDESHLYYLFMSCDPETQQRELRVLYLDGRKYAYSDGIRCQSHRVWLRLDVNCAAARFYYSENGQTFRPIGRRADASKLSDDYAGGFTGAAVGMACQDLSMHAKTADFLYFRYENTENDELPNK